MYSKSSLTVGVVVFSLGLLFCTYILFHNVYLVNHSIRTEGVVMQMNPYVHTPYPSRTLPVVDYRPIISFVTSDGKQVEIAGCDNCYHLGDKVPVIYDPSDPNEGHVDDQKDLYVTPLFFMIGFGTALAKVFYERKKMVV